MLNCDPTVNQILMRISYCIDYNEEDGCREDDVVMTGASIPFTEVEVIEDNLAGAA